MNPSQQELLNQHGPNIQASVAHHNLAQTNTIQYEKWRNARTQLSCSLSYLWGRTFVYSRVIDPGEMRTLSSLHVRHIHQRTLHACWNIKHIKNSYCPSLSSLGLDTIKKLIKACEKRRCPLHLKKTFAFHIIFCAVIDQGSCVLHFIAFALDFSLVRSHSNGHI